MAFTKITFGDTEDTVRSAFDKVNDIIDDIASTTSGLGASQVGIADSGSLITGTNVETALAENRTAINLNTAKVTNATHTGDVTGATELTIASGAVTYAKMQLDDDGIPLAKIAGGRPISYVRTMTGNETPAYVQGFCTVNHLDPGGADRTFNPTASFPAGYEMVIINVGEEIITFDSASLGQAVGPGQKMHFYFNGTNWF